MNNKKRYILGISIILSSLIITSEATVITHYVLNKNNANNKNDNQKIKIRWIDGEK